jgi:hypothetical protein
MQVKSFTNQQHWRGTHHRQRILSTQRMDAHTSRMLASGWEILTQTRPFPIQPGRSAVCQT